MILPCSIKHAVAHMSAEADTFVKAHANLVFQACRRGLPFLDVEWYIPFPPLDASTYERRRQILLPKFLPISFFRRVSRFIGVSGHLALQ